MLSNRLSEHFKRQTEYSDTPERKKIRNKTAYAA